MAVTFKLRDPAQDHVVKWPVWITSPTDGGNIAKQKLTAHFLVLPQSEVQEILGGDTMLAKADGNLNLLRRVWVDWSGVGAEGSDEELPFSPELRDRVLDDLAAQEALITAYFQMLRGHKAKN